MAPKRTHFLRNLHPNNPTSREPSSVNDDAERLGRLPPSVKVAIAIDMTDTCVRTCAAGIRAQNPGITEAELIEKLRERLDWTKRHQTRENRTGKL
jgi:hypothetical protein